MEGYYMIKEFFNSPQVLKKAPNTRKAYERDLTSFSQYLAQYNVSIDNLNDIVVQQYLSQLKTKEGKPCSAATINRVFASIRTFCHWSNQLGAIFDISIPKVPHISKQPAKGLSKEEITSLRLKVANNQKNPNKLRDQAIVDFFIYSGCRVSELVSLNRDDIQYHKGIYTVLIKETKNDEPRKAFFDSKEFKYIKRYLDSRQDECEPLFLSSRGRISVRMVQTILNNYGINPHLLRHTFCSVLARENIDPFTIAQLAGHRDMNTTRRYANPTEQEMADTVSKVFDF